MMKRTLSILLALLLPIMIMTGCTFIDGIINGQEDPPCAHEYEAVITAPTCTAEGYTTYTCKLCQDTYTADQTALIAHNYKDGKCSACGAADPNYVPPCEHEWAEPTCTEAGYCTKCNATGDAATGHSFADGECSACGAADPNYEPPCEHDWADPTCTKDGYCTKCDAPGQASTGHSDEDGNFLCDDCSSEYIPDTHEKVDYALNISDLTIGVLSADEINGVFTIVSGSEIRSRSKTFEGVSYSQSVKIGNSATKIKISVPGSGKLSFLVQNGSSGADMQFITVTGPNGEVQNIEFEGNVSGSPVVKIELDVTEGEWTISRGKNGGTQDVFALNLSCIVEKSEENGFELVAKGKVDYLVGETLDLSGIRLNSTFSNGKTEPLGIENATVDASAVNFAESGVYTLTVSYKEYAPITIEISVYAPEEIELGFDAIEKIANNSYGNGVYYNHSFKELYFVGDELDLSGLTVTVIAKCGESTKRFTVDDYTVSGYDFSECTENSVVISYGGLETVINIWTTDNMTFEPDEDGEYKLLVDPNYLSVPGYLSGPYYVFTSIQQALEATERMDPNVMKNIYLPAGIYYEKLEITVPNLRIIGWGERSDDVVIEWGSIYGQPDASGFVHVTDSTATVAIRETAYNVTFENITISNYWNSQERMDAAGLEVERALALLVQADRFVMKNSKLLGIQDTLELFTGRQYFENVFISGYTDFIFGTNNTTLFKNCTIHVIDTAKDDKGTAGYITAFKGSNKGANDSIIYGAIFDGCNFTADEGVTPGCTAIGRTWAAYAAVAVINSELGAHISLNGYSTNKNERYVSMNANPTADTVKFVEYNNTGAGAITEAVAGMRFLTDEEAALYTDIAVIFGTVNGNVTYLDSWDPFYTGIEVDDRTYYNFDGTESTTGTSYTYDQDIQGAMGMFGDIIIDATLGKVTARASDTQLNAGAKLIFEVEAGTLVTVISYPGYGYYTLNGVAHNATDMFSQYYSETTTVVLEATATAYLYQIIINPNEDALDAPVLSEIKVDGMNLNYTVGDELSLDGVILKGYYSDFSIVTLEGYTVDHSAVDPAKEGSYDVIFSYGGLTLTLTVIYEDPNADPAITTTTTLDFTTEDGYNAVVNNSRVQLDGSFRKNGAEYQVKGTITFQVKAGTCVTVIPYGDHQYVAYTIDAIGVTDLPVLNEMYSIMFFEDCTVVYTGLDNNYLCQIIIEPPLADGKYVFGNASDEGDVTGITESIPGLSLSGDFKPHSGGVQMNEYSQIIFIAPALATITVKGYDASYGLLEIWADGGAVEMQGDGFYVFTTGYASTIIINALNAGTEEAPDWSKSYLTYIQIDTPDFITEDMTVTFGTEGNYNTLEEFDFSGITIGNNGGNNAQIKNGSFTFALKAGTTLVINGYPGYTDYNLTAEGYTYYNIIDTKFTYELYADSIITISHDAAKNGNNYFYSFQIITPVELVNESFEITFGSEGNYKEGSPYVDLSTVQIGDNGGNNSQVKNGHITVKLLAGATMTVNGYPGYTSYTITDITSTTDVITDSVYVYTASEDCNVIIAPMSGNNYFYSIQVAY